MARVALVLVGLFLFCVPAWAGGAGDADAGIARLNAGDAAAAVELFTRAIQSKELNPETLALTYHHRGMAFFREGQAGRAILDYTTALWNEDLPKEFRPRTLNNRGLAFEAINDFESAMRDYNLAIRLNPNYAEAYGNRGGLYRRNNRNDEAISDYDMALRNNHPHPKYVFTWQGMSQEALGRRREAMDSYRRALSLDPAFGLAKERLAKLDATQPLGAVMNRKRPNTGTGGPLVLSATPGSRAEAALPGSTPELSAAPWTPPQSPALPSIKETPPPPSNGGELQPTTAAFSLRPAFDDQTKNAAARQLPAAAVVPPPVPAPAPAQPKAAPPARTVPAVEIITPRRPPSTANGEGGSDTEYALQLGSFKTDELAQAGWKTALKSSGDLLDGMNHIVEPVVVAGKGQMFRLFAEAVPDREAALNLCRTLRDKGTLCIVVRR